MSSSTSLELQALLSKVKRLSLSKLTQALKALHLLRSTRTMSSTSINSKVVLSWIAQRTEVSRLISKAEKATRLTIRTLLVVPPTTFTPRPLITNLAGSSIPTSTQHQKTIKTFIILRLSVNHLGDHLFLLLPVTSIQKISRSVNLRSH